MHGGIFSQCNTDIVFLLKNISNGVVPIKTLTIRLISQGDGEILANRKRNKNIIIVIIIITF